MDKKFGPKEAVHALDTNTGTWRVALVQFITRVTVTLIFPEFASRKNTLTETIHEEALTTMSAWPIRKAFDVSEPESLGRRVRRRQGAATLTYEPSSRILDDVVSKYIIHVFQYWN